MFRLLITFALVTCGIVLVSYKPVSYEIKTCTDNKRERVEKAPR